MLIGDVMSVSSNGQEIVLEFSSWLLALFSLVEIFLLVHFELDFVLFIARKSD